MGCGPHRMLPSPSYVHGWPGPAQRALRRRRTLRHGQGPVGRGNGIPFRHRPPRRSDRWSRGRGTGPLDRLGELGYWVRTDRCGRGYATEASSSVVEFGFEEAGLHRLELRAGVDNRASQRVAEKLGFQQEGRLRQGGRGAEVPYDCYVYGLLVSDPAPRNLSEKAEGRPGSLGHPGKQSQCRLGVTVDSRPGEWHRMMVAAGPES